MSRKEHLSCYGVLSRIINPLLIKLVRSKWLDIGLVLFLRVYGKKRTWPISHIQPSWPNKLGQYSIHLSLGVIGVWRTGGKETRLWYRLVGKYEPKSSLWDDKATPCKLPMLEEIFSSRQFYRVFILLAVEPDCTVFLETLWYKTGERQGKRESRLVVALHTDKLNHWWSQSGHLSFIMCMTCEVYNETTSIMMDPNAQ